MTSAGNRIRSFWKGLREKDDISVSIPFLCRAVILIILAGVVIRLVLGFFMTYVFDMYHWGAVIQNINSGNGLYEITGFFYTPPWGYILGLESLFQNLTGVTVIGERLTDTFLLEDIGGRYTSTVVTPFFALAVKLIFMLSDLVVGYLIFWLVRDITKDQKKAVAAFALWFLCPFVITVGSVIGMFDTISVLMTLLAVIMLRKDRYVEAGVMLGLATLTKFFPGFFIFIFLAYIVAKNRDGSARRKTALFLAGIVVIAFIIFLPQLLDGTIADSFLFITSRVSEGVDSGVIGKIGGYAALVVYALTLIVSAILAKRLLRNDGETGLDRRFLDALMVTTAVMFLYPPLPQYVLLLLPFILFAMIYETRYRIPCILLMIGTTVASVAGGPMNLVSVAAYTNILGLGPVMRAVGICTSPFLGFEAISIVGLAGYVLQYAGILFVLWIRFGEDIKRKVSRERSGMEASADTVSEKERT